MNPLWQVLGILAVACLVIGGLGWIALRARQRGVGGSVLGAVDEIFHPMAYESQNQIQVQSERKVAKPARVDPPWPGGAPPT